MCNKSCIDFVKRSLKEENVRGKSVIEVGSLDVNGSPRSIVESFNPGEYIGVDIQMGPGVDQICNAEGLIIRFGYNRFDVLICTEVLEHVRNWEKVVRNLKHIVKPGGIVLITTVSRGFQYHGYPFDFWRYEISDMGNMFSDFNIEILEKDPQEYGVFLLARKPKIFVENRVVNLDLYSVILEKRASIIRTNIYWEMVKIQVKILRLKDEEYYVQRVIYYNKHPFDFLVMIGRKGVRFITGERT